MNIGIDLSEFPFGKAGGVETYARKLIEEFSRIGEKDKFFIILPEDLENIPRCEGNVQPVFFTRPTILKKLANKIIRKITKKDILYLKNLNKIIRENNIEILHYLCSVIHCMDVKIPVILSVMDIQQEYYPGFFSRKELASRKKRYRPSCQKAKRIIAISEFTKATLVERYKIPAEKIKVVHLGSELSKDFEEVDNLPKEFIYYPAGTWPHKNHENLFKAMKILKESHRSDIKLVLTGISTSHAEAIDKSIKDKGLGETIVVLGHLKYSQIPYVYSKAKALVFPSYFEGFGMPVLEAMKMGVPVACSNLTSLPEIVGEAALTFDPRDPQEIAETILSVLDDEQTRTALIRKGLNQAKAFSWDKTCRETLNTYKETYGILSEQSSQDICCHTNS